MHAMYDHVRLCCIPMQEAINISISIPNIQFHKKVEMLYKITSALNSSDFLSKVAGGRNGC